MGKVPQVKEGREHSEQEEQHSQGFRGKNKHIVTRHSEQTSLAWKSRVDPSVESLHANLRYLDSIL